MNATDKPMLKLDRVAVLSSDDSSPLIPIVAGGGHARAVVWPGVGATMRSMHHIVLDPGSATAKLSHPMEAVYYVIRGEGIVRDPDKGSVDRIAEGSMIHIEPETAYVCEADGSGMELIGGPCPADPRLYLHLL
jgi:mannose-6-phosphate isomerase-like protein (cupin superfamily)